jgi:hypothetical protein
MTLSAFSPKRETITPHRFADAVVVAHAAAHLAADLERGDGPEQDRRAAFADPHDHLRQVVEAAQIAAAAHHVFVLTQLDHRSADVVVRALDRHHDVLER